MPNGAIFHSGKPMHFKVHHFVTWQHLIVKNVWTKRFVSILTNRILALLRHMRWPRHRVKSHETSRKLLFFGLRHRRFCLLTGASHADCWRWHRWHRCKMQNLYQVLTSHQTSKLSRYSEVMTSANMQIYYELRVSLFDQ